MSKAHIRVTPTELSPALAPAVWVGAVSFEQRCLGSLGVLASLGLTLSAAMVIDYPTEVIPVTAASKKRRVHWAKMRDTVMRMAASDQCWSPAKIHPYRLGAFRGALQRLLCQEASRTSRSWIVDITCLTKAHTLALASWLVATRGTRPDVIVAYTRPEQYGTPARHRSMSGRWVDTVLAPLELNPQKFLEKANGIVLLGHEGARLSMALAQLAPLNAVVFLSRTTDREDLQIVTRAANARLLGEVERGERSGWSVQQVDTQDVETVETVTKKFVSQSVTEERRVVLYPFGPKPLVFAAGVAALATKVSAIWYCYPIPKAYDVDYTIGVGSTAWFSL